MTYSKKQTGWHARSREPFAEAIAAAMEVGPWHRDFLANNHTESRQWDSPRILPATANVPAESGQPVGSCCHYWLIETSVEPHSKGVCKLCGEERFFRNFLRWEESSPAVRKSNGRRGNEGTDDGHREEQYPIPSWLRRSSRTAGLRSGARGF